NWEKGKREPTLENVVKLAKLFKTTTDELLGQTI
ncbi:helix-turn-helix domain-containing protein, partial [Streptococcus dysgalactiae]